MRSIATPTVFVGIACVIIGCLDGPTAPTVSTSATAPAASKPVEANTNAGRLEALAPGDQVTVHFQSDGCFHHFMGDAVLTRTPDGLAVRVVKAVPNVMPGWRRITETTLTLSEVRAFDRLLTFYRDGPGGGCTTVDRVTIKGLSSNSANGTEFYIDGSCATFERDDVFYIGRLFRIVRDSTGTGAA